MLAEAKADIKNNKIQPALEGSTRAVSYRIIVIKWSNPIVAINEILSTSLLCNCQEVSSERIS